MKLKNISLEYEDGSTKTLSSSNLDTKLQSALVESGLCDPLPVISAAKQYLIMQWKDGWKEVLAINSDIADLIRYYIIRRIEDRGRIALDLGAGYPTLIIIERQPKEMSRMMIVSDQAVKSYGLESEIEGYEGIFEAGGKKEYKKFDKANPFFKNEFSESGDALNDIKVAVSEALKKMGLRPDELLTTDRFSRLQEYKDIARLTNINGFKSQSDVYGFIELILKSLG
jgi:hypothetical protein